MHSKIAAVAKNDRVAIFAFAIVANAANGFFWRERLVRRLDQVFGLRE
jgi:hypothetical protein